MHSHPHAHGAADQTAQRMLYALLLTGLFTLVELVGGLWAGSLALLADAGHMLSDTAALALAVVASRIARRPADRLRSYGYHRVQILAAFTNGAAFVLIVGWIFVEAAQRLMDPPPVTGGVMLVVAVLGLLVNLVAYRLLHSSDAHDLNARGALLHVLGDLLGSAAAIIAALVILGTGWTPIDPLLSMLVALLILRSAWRLVRQSAHILLEGTPEGQDAEQIRATLVAEIGAVLDVHHVHLWSLTPERPLLTLHATLTPDAHWPDVLAQIKRILDERFGLHHSTVQLETGHCADAVDRHA
jgi:cobalt-zinc-cadmium efflux system protein